MHLADFNAALLYNTDEGTVGYRTGFSYNRFYPVSLLSKTGQTCSAIC
jgi:hypothetical protein